MVNYLVVQVILFVGWSVSAVAVVVDHFADNAVAYNTVGSTVIGNTVPLFVKIAFLDEVWVSYLCFHLEALLA